MKRTLIVLLAAILTLAMLAGCSSAKTEDSISAEEGYDNGSSGSDYAPSQAPEAVYDSADKGLTAGEVYQNENGQTVDELYGGRKVIRTYNLTIQTNDFDNVLTAIQVRLFEYGGYSQSTTVDGKKPSSYGDAGRNATMTLRIPADKADEFIQGIKGLGTLLNIRDYSDDITDQYFDVDSRLSVLQTELERLENILVKTDNLADVIALEARISDVMLEIEQLTGTLKKYDALVTYTTVDISLYEESLKEGPADVKSTGERIAEGFTDSLYGVGTFFTNLFVWLVSSLPVLVLLAVITVAVIIIVRHSIKRRARKRAESAAKAAVRQQALFEQQKAAYMEQQKTQAYKTNELKEDADNEVK